MMVKQLLKLKPIFSRGGRQEKSSGKRKPEPGRELDDTCEQRRRIVNAFANCLADRRPFNEIRDASELPYPKMEILAATAREIRYSDNDDRVQHLKLMAGFLADYQDNVGSSPLSLMGTDDEPGMPRHDSGDPFPDPLSIIARNPARERYRLYQEMSERELRYIHSHLTEAEASRNRSERVVA